MAYEQLKLINFGLYYKQVSVEYAKPDPNRQQLTEYVTILCFIKKINTNGILFRPVALSIEQQEQAADPISLTQG